MAFGAKKIFPIDTRPGTGVGVGLPFNAPAVFPITYTTKEAIKNNLINYFLTNKNERYLNPTFGGNLRAFIFQQITDNNIEYLEQDIQNQIGLYFPNVIIASLDINSYPDINQIEVILTYNIKDTGLTDTIQLAFI
jgi:phage baseplate assembly protein W